MGSNSGLETPTVTEVTVRNRAYTDVSIFCQKWLLWVRNPNQPCRDGSPRVCDACQSGEETSRFRPEYWYEKFGARKTPELHVFLRICKKKHNYWKKPKKTEKRRNFTFFPVISSFFCNLNLTKCVKRHLQETRPCVAWVLSILDYRKL